MEKIKLIKDWWKKANKSSNSYDKGGIKPYRDWKIILVSTFFVLVIVGGLSTYLYMEVGQGRLFAVSDTESVNEAKINRPVLDKAIGVMKERKSLFDGIKNGEGIPADPSI